MKKLYILTNQQTKSNEIFPAFTSDMSASHYELHCVFTSARI